MLRPKPHALRRALYFTNFGLLLLLVVPFLPWPDSATDAEAVDADSLRVAWVTARRTDLRWRPQPPVSDRDFESAFLGFRGHRPAHWPFVGPLPPAPAPERPDEPEDGGPLDLAALGKPHMLISGEGEPVLGFTFHGPPRTAIEVAPGEFIRARPSDPARFRFVGIESRSAHVDHVHYEVLADGAVVREAYLLCDRRGPPLRQGGLRVGNERDVRTDAPTPASTPSVTNASLETLAPTRHINPRNRRDRVIEFDQATHALLGSGGLGALLGHVKTAPAVDPETGRALGIQVRGYDKRLPADRFDVRKGDVLVSVAGRAVTNRAELLRIAETLDPETLVPVVIDRRGTLHTYRIDARDPRNKRAIRYFDDPE